MDTLKRQYIIFETIEKMRANFQKDSAGRKTADYIEKRRSTLEALWEEFTTKHEELKQSDDETILNEDYDKLVDNVKSLYNTFKNKLQTCAVATTEKKGIPSPADELFSQQTTNFRAFTRMVRNIDFNQISERWEIEDKLQMLQSRWKAIDEVHWKLDNMFIGADVDYEQEYTHHESIYELTKKQLHQKLNSTAHQLQAVPKVEIPTFSGNYAQWPTFNDLFSEAIHNNNMINKAQKMQHLKGKLRGEAERMVQHLSVSAENYDTCWELLNHRYNNMQLLFTKQMQIFLNQPTIQQQTAFEIKRLHDTSLEVVHAIHNLGVDTSSWDPFLVHILTNKLDSDTYASYMESRKKPRELPHFDEFIEFLEGKFTALEPVVKRKQTTSQHRTSPGQARDFPSTSQNDGHNNGKFKRFIAKSYHANTERNCPICKTNHLLLYCKTFQNMTPTTKKATISQLNICENCLFSHNGKQCTSIKRCRVCNTAHHTSLHDLLRDTARVSPASTMTATYEQSETLDKQRRSNNHVSGNFNEVLLATVQMKVKAADGSVIQLRCLLDQGSQINLITESAAQRLGLKRQKHNATVSGIGLAAKQSNGTVQLICQSLYGDHEFTTDALVMSNMINNLPNYSFEKQQWSHLANINLADPDYNICRPIDVLLDAGVYAEIIMDGILRGPAYAPIAQQTKLGWVLLGNVKTFNCHAVLNSLEDIAQFWELEDIPEQSNKMTPTEEYCETLYNTTTTRLKNGRYEVKIPMQPNFEENLGASKPQAVAQFLQLEKRLAKNEELCNSYKNFINEYIKLGHMKQCTVQREPSCFLPHFGIMKPDSTTTRLRTVFNASNPTKSGKSLNQLMESGPNLQQDLQAIILRWRSYRHVYTADIEKFYRQILIREEDQHLQKIVWRNTPSEPIQEFLLCTLTYGTKAAGYLAMRTIKQLVTDDGPQYPLAAAILDKQLYVDDLLGGNNDLNEAKTSQKQLISLLKAGGFNLRKWASNNPCLLEDLTEDQISQNMLDFKNVNNNKTLGLLWNPCTDQFTFNIAGLNTGKNDVITKRSLLSDLSKLYDPLGWLSPVTMKGKLIFQQVWKQPLSWDEALPRQVQEEWKTFRTELPMLNNITISRWIGDAQQLHGYCDASEKGYGCVIYCKGTNEHGQTTVKQIAAKTKLAPINRHVTLPRMELCGMVLLAKLMRKTIDSLNNQTVQVYGWTDSTVALGWLQGDITRWKTFVANRVSQVTQVIPSNCWRHVRSEDNPADCASRGILPSQLLTHHLWFEGPPSLSDNIPTEAPVYEEPTEERKPTKQTCSLQLTSPIIETLLNNNSSMTRVVRALTWVSRFANNASGKNKMRSPYLTTSELRNALTAIVRSVQNKHFSEEIAQLKKHKNISNKSRLLKLNPILDDKNVLRVGGRLEHACVTYAQKHPIILPHNDRLTELLIQQAHITTLHGGPRLTLSHLRNNYWILRGVRTVKDRLRTCIKCHRFKPTTNNQVMADLPAPRVTPSRPFTHTGVDFTGYVEVKANKGRGIKTTKGYIAVFVCLSTKAVHLELVSDLSSETFLAALHRLSARRGAPQHLYSDNGTNFIGAARILARERKDALEHYANTELLATLANSNIEWHFSAPAWPTANGEWEAAVKSTKYHLRRVLGEQKLTFEEFSTLLAQIESCLNSRPLSPLTDDIDDLEYLTPGHFLVGGPVLAGPLSPEQEARNIRTRWQLTEKLHKDFWKRWSAEYLHSLQTRSKWNSVKRNLKIGDMVLVKEDNTPPARWLLGRVTETHPGKDGHVRVVSLKTKTNIMKRPITKLSPLPIKHTEDEVSTPKTQANKQEQTRTQRVKKPGYNSYTCLLFLMLATCIPASTQQTANVMELNPKKLIYFDKLADMQIIQDQWKVVVYYNMTTYWEGLKSVENYVNRFTNLGSQETAFATVAAQLKHELRELKHYNDILTTDHGLIAKREKRGLIDGVGYLANSLFGVLDERFAQQYDQDIHLVHNNENHLLSLFKNHTSIIEGEYNLLKRHEEVMNQQFTAINRHLKETDQRSRADHQEVINNIYNSATALSANMVMGNLRRVQQMLLDLITDVKDGRVNMHLLKPEQFEDQLNIISGQLPGELSLPCANTKYCIRDMYKLSRVHVHLTDNFIIFEIKLPLVNTEHYELNRIIPIPQILSQTTQRIVATSEYLAVNLKKDAVIPLSHQDIASCLQVKEHNLLCRMSLPIYDTKASVNICEAQLINNKNISPCKTITSECADNWIQLHRPGAWLFACCQECAMRTFCPAGVTPLILRGTGIITLNTGCMIKGDNVIIQSHNNFHSEMTISEDNFYVQESSINRVIVEKNYSVVTEDHREALNKLKTSIDTVKMQQDTLQEITSSHETHHYTFISFIVICTVATSIWASICIRSKMRNTAARVITKEQKRKKDIGDATFRRFRQPQDADTVSEVKRDDNLPNLVCVTCYKELEHYYAFRKRCEVAYQRLNSHLLASRSRPAVEATTEENEEILKDIGINQDENMNINDFGLVNGEDALINKGQESTPMISNVHTVNTDNPEIQELRSMQPEELSTLIASVLVKLGILAQRGSCLAVQRSDVSRLQLEAGDAVLRMELVEEDCEEEQTPIPKQELFVEEADLIPAESPEPNVVEQKPTVVQHKATFVEPKKKAPKIHTNIGAMACSTCGRVLASRSALRRHERTHSGERPYACPRCERAFAQKEVMHRHMLVHEAVRPHKCSTCNKSFTQRNALALHERSHLPPHERALALHSCPHCPKLFLYSSGLSRHMMTHSGRVYVCGVCRRQFADKSSVLRHHRARHRREPEHEPEHEREHEHEPSKLADHEVA